MKIKSFYKNNTHYFIINFLHALAMWSYNILLPMILNKYYGYSEAILSYSVTSFIIFFFLGSSATNIKLENTINYVKLLMSSYLYIAFLSIIIATVVILEINPLLYIALKGVEGFLSGVIYVLLTYLLKILLKNHKRNGTINAMNSSILFLIKAIIPLIITSYFLIENFEIAVYFIGTFLYSIIGIFIYINRKKIMMKYQRVINKQLEKKSHTNFKTSIMNIVSLLRHKNHLKDKIHYILVLIIQNFLRPFYDLYIVLLLVNNYNFSIAHVTSITVFMVFGQATQLISGYISDKINLSLYRFMGLILFSVPFVVIITFPDILTNYYYAIIIFYIFGVGRSFYSGYDYKLVMRLISKKIKINHISFITLGFGETSHYLSYLFLGLLLSLGITLEELFIIPYYIIFFLFIVWAVFDTRYLCEASIIRDR